eukprot:GEMP01009920.1.p1 GENE.GEMP01009920.1~~GEMP01009920.1.p1  ORF type:complete len:814 (+),score=202.72 GEMP01009920.1:116-2557(+)
MAPLRNGRAGQTHSGQQWYMDRAPSGVPPPLELGRRPTSEDFGRRTTSEDFGRRISTNILRTRTSPGDRGFRTSTEDFGRQNSMEDIVRQTTADGITKRTSDLQEELRHCTSAPTFKRADFRADLPKLDVEKRANTADSQLSGSPKSNASPLRRENKQLRIELKQLQVSLLDSLRRSDRFISGGQFKGKKHDPPQSRIAEDSRHLKAELRRAYKAMDDLQQQLAETKHGFEQEQLSSAEKDTQIDRLVLSTIEKSDTLKKTTEKHLQESNQYEVSTEQLETQLKSALGDLRNATIALERETERAQAAAGRAESLTTENDMLAQHLKEAHAKLQDAGMWKRDFLDLRQRFNELEKQDTLKREVQREKDENNSEKKKKNVQMITRLERLTTENERLRQEGRSRNEGHQADISELLRKHSEDSALTRYELDSWKSRCTSVEEAEATLREQLSGLQQAQHAQAQAMQADTVANAERQKLDKRLLAQERSQSRAISDELRAMRMSVDAAKEKNAQCQLALTQHEQSKQRFIRTISTMMDNATKPVSAVFSAWRIQTYLTKRAKIKLALEEAEKTTARLSAAAASHESNAQRALSGQNNAIADRNRAVTELQRANAELLKLRVEARSLKNELDRLKKEVRESAGQRADERENNKKSLASMDNNNDALKKALEDSGQEASVNRQQYLEAQHKLDKAVLELGASRREVASVNERMAGLGEKLKAERRHSLSSRMQKQLKLQILAPRVSVSIGGDLTDAESAPSPEAIRKVMIEQVLPKFAQVNLAGENEGEESVQEIMSEMVKSIETKLMTIFGRTCLRTG